jgi:hypothetical protein
MAEPGIRDNEELNRYELVVDGAVAFLEYRRTERVIMLVHTEVPESLRGSNRGGSLARHALDEARATGRRVAVRCPFVASWIRRHPEYEDLQRPPTP